MVELHWDEEFYAEESAALRSLPADENILVIGTDFSNAPRTVSRLIEARRAGTVVALYPMLTDPLERIVQQVSSAIMAQGDEGTRFVQMTALRDNRLQVNQKSLAENAVYDAEIVRAATLAVKLADVLLIFTAAEKERWSAVAGRPIRRFAYLPAPRAHAAPTADSGVAIYAPHAAATDTRLAEFALAQRGIHAKLETSKTPSAASTLIVTAWWRPALAMSLSGAGYRVIASANGGPDERCECAVYRPTDAFGLSAAIDASLTLSPQLRFDITPEQTLAVIRANAIPQAGGETVSVIVRTFDRPELLQRALRSIAAQRYRPVEAVVVNNGGADVRDVVQRACGALPYQYVALPNRQNISAASNAGARVATGTLIAYLDDDDILYPDHLARAVDALQRSRADLVYTNCVAEYARVHGDRKDVVGFQVFRDSEWVPSELYVDNVAPIHSIVHRRDLFEGFGYFDEDLAVTDDWEMWLRASRGAAFTHLDRFTCEYSWRHDPDRGNMTLTHQMQFANAYAKVTERYAADVAQFEHIVARQAHIKAAQATRAQSLAELGEKAAQITFEAMANASVRAEPFPADPFK